MKIRYIILTCSLCAGLLLSACKKPTENKGAITIGVKDSVYSSILKEQRKLLVYVPSSAGASPAYPQRFPVVYLLDGDAHFLSVTAMLEYLSGNQVCPPMIVVAIPNADRSRDLTPTHSLLLPDGSSQDFLKTTGGGEQFTSFIEKELIPYIESHYPTAPNKTLIGHSFGGLFAINTLINHPGMFDNYVAIDPSMWWDKRKLLFHADTVLKTTTFNKKKLFISVANTMAAGMDTAHVATDTTGNSSHIRSILHLARQVNANRANGLQAGWKYYDDDDHGSVPMISEYDAIHFIFQYYKPKQFDITSLTADAIEKHFKKISEKIGYTMLPPESGINETAYYLLRDKKYDQALGLFNLNCTNYPKSANVWDSMGDLHLNKGDTARAKEMYQKALDLNDNKDTRKKLADLKK